MKVIARLIFKDREANVLRWQGEVFEVSEERAKVLISRNVAFEAPIEDVPPKGENSPTKQNNNRGRGRGKN